MVSQLLHPELPSHQISDTDHGVLDIVDILGTPTQFLCLFIRQQLRDQRFHPLFNRLVSCHPWLLCLN
jgi:hypothetical protein